MKTLFGSGLLLTLLLSPSAFAQEQTYPDVPTDAWYFPYVQELTDQGIVSGYPDGRFGAWDPVLRAELAKMIALSLEKEDEPWWQENLIGILLVLITLIAWGTMAGMMKKMLHEVTEAQRNLSMAVSAPGAVKPSSLPQRTSPLPLQTPAPGPKAPPPPPAPPIKKEEKTPAPTDEKNVKTNWWM